jgi:hypothetical protein
MKFLARHFSLYLLNNKYNNKKYTISILLVLRFARYFMQKKHAKKILKMKNAKQ